LIPIVYPLKVSLTKAGIFVAEGVVSISPESTQVEGFRADIYCINLDAFGGKARVEQCHRN